ncbi:MAG: AAA family ATPase, partial [Psychrobacter sp.]|nr:AAA family ATPase [Psychrobacter sp.]
MTSKQDKTINNPSKTVQKNADAKTLAKRAPSKYASRLSAKGSEATPEAVASRCLLPVKQLKRHSDPASLPLSTDLAEPLDIKFGQQRAIKAITTALNIKASGYHVFAAGENGLGKRTLITRLLTQIAQNQPTPNDWVYVHNFNQPRSPIALSLPPSQASKLKQTMDELWRVAKQRLTQRFRSDSYQSQIEAINNKTHQQEAA